MLISEKSSKKFLHSIQTFFLKLLDYKYHIIRRFKNRAHTDFRIDETFQNR